MPKVLHLLKHKDDTSYLERTINILNFIQENYINYFSFSIVDIKYVFCLFQILSSYEGFNEKAKVQKVLIHKIPNQIFNFINLMLKNIQAIESLKSDEIR